MKRFDVNHINEAGKEFYKAISEICVKHSGGDFSAHEMIVALVGAGAMMMGSYGSKPRDLQETIAFFSREVTNHLVENADTLEERHSTFGNSPIDDILSMLHKALEDGPVKG